MMILEKDEFWLSWCREELSLGRTVRIVASGFSMIPTIWPSEIIEIEPISIDHVKTDDIIAFQRIQHIVVHRVVLIKDLNDEIHLTTMGDSNLQVDEAINKANFIGKVHIKDNGSVLSHKPVLITRGFYSVIAFFFTCLIAVKKRIISLILGKKSN